MIEWDDGRQYDRAEDANDRADWDDQVRHWQQQRQDALTRDAGENPYLPKHPWPTHAERVRDAGYEADDPKGKAIP